MQVVQPYPTRWKPSCSSGSVSPARSRYSVTTFEPGASEVLTHGFERRPRATALRARMPAPIITDGFDVLVQLVIAAITTCPWSSVVSVPSASATGTALARAAVALPASQFCDTRLGELGLYAETRVLSVWPGLVLAGGSLEGKLAADAESWKSYSGTRPASEARNAGCASVSEIRSCGRFGPASDGTTSPRSSSTMSE